MGNRTKTNKIVKIIEKRPKRVRPLFYHSTLGFFRVKATFVLIGGSDKN